MTAQIFKMRDGSIKEMVDEIHKQFAAAFDAGKKADRARIHAGRLLIALRKRIEAGEVGENVSWWKWYDDHFARSKKDAMKVMKIASAEDPEAAHEAEIEKNRRQKQSHRCDQSEAEDLVSHALRLVDKMDANQRQRFFAELGRLYAHQY